MPAKPGTSRAEDLRRWRAQFTDARPIAELVPRHPATCAGVVHKIRFDPDHALEVTVDDGSGRLTGVWSGRTGLPGLELGGGLLLTGTVARVDDRLLMRNPGWSLVVEPYA